MSTDEESVSSTDLNTNSDSSSTIELSETSSSESIVDNPNVFDSPLVKDPRYLEFAALLSHLPSRFSSDPDQRPLNGFPSINSTITNLPPVKAVVRSRLHSSSFGVLSSMPSAVILFLSSILYLYSLTSVAQETEDNKTTNPREIPAVGVPWRPELLPLILPGNISLTILMSIGNFWGFGTQSFKYIVTEKKRFTYYIVLIAVMWISTFLMMFGYASKDLLLVMYILSFLFTYVWYKVIKPVFVEYATGKRGSDKETGAAAFPWFVTMGLFQAFGMTFMLAIYQLVLVNTFFSISDPLTQFLIRFFLHPILYELVVAIYRVYMLYLNYCFHKAGKHLYHWYIFCIPAQFIFSFYGRLMIASLPTLELQIFTAVLLAGQDQMLRSFMQNRDNFFLSALQWVTCKLGKTDTLLFQLRKNEHGAFNNFSYANLYITDEIAEVSGIFLSPIIIAAFKLGTKDHGPPPASTLIVTALVSFLFEIGSDLLRAVYYLKTTSYIENGLTKNPEASYADLVGASELPFAAKVHFFWRNVEYSIHEAFENRMKYYGWMLSWYHIAAIFFLLQGFFTANFCGMWNGTEITHTYYCSGS